MRYVLREARADQGCEVAEVDEEVPFSNGKSPK